MLLCFLKLRYYLLTAFLLGILYVLSLPASPTPALALASSNHLLQTPSCLEADLFQGHWHLGAGSASAPFTLGQWVPAQHACLPSPAPSLRSLCTGRKVALVGDSVSRYLAIDLAVALFDCSLGWNGASCEGAASASASPVCSQLRSYACHEKKHESLHLEGSGGTTLTFVWVTVAEALTHDSFRSLLADATWDAILVSLGMWDVAVKTEGSLSVAHHCGWMHSHVKEVLESALGAHQGLQHRLRFWQPPYTEPANNNHVRIPHSDMATVNECSRHAFPGSMYTNTTAMLSAPAEAFSALLSARAALLTMEGYHPTMQVRAVLLQALLQAVLPPLHT